jgi:hypothetical protein
MPAFEWQRFAQITIILNVRNPRQNSPTESRLVITSKAVIADVYRQKLMT